MSNYRYLIGGGMAAYPASGCTQAFGATGLIGAKSHPSLQTSATFQRFMARQANGKNPVSNSRAEGNAMYDMLRVSLGNSRQNHHPWQVPICFNKLPAKNDAY
ncbi:MAG TPA: hypothetical protein VIF10_05195 [Methylobacter sp.]|jgi:hypothetical protein